MKKLSILCILICLLFLSSCDGLTPMLLNDIESLDNLENVFAEKDDGLSYSEAKEQGGFFVMKDNDCFLPVQESVHKSNDNLFFTDAESEDVPKAEASDKIVLFTGGTLDEGYWFIPVIKEGYTIPFTFYNVYDEKTEEFDRIGIADISFAINAYDDYQAEAMKDYYGGIFKEFNEVIEIANGMPAEKFFSGKIVDPDEYCTWYGCINDSIYHAKEYCESLTIEFFHGTYYCEETFYADLKYYLFDGCERKTPNRKYYAGEMVETELTKEGYAQLNTENLNEGKYIIVKGSDKFIVEISR